MDVIPDSPPQVGAVRGGEGGHIPKSVIQQVPNVRIQSVD